MDESFFWDYFLCCFAKPVDVTCQLVCARVQFRSLYMMQWIDRLPVIFLNDCEASACQQLATTGPKLQERRSFPVCSEAVGRRGAVGHGLESLATSFKQSIVDISGEERQRQGTWQSQTCSQSQS